MNHNSFMLRLLLRVAYKRPELNYKTHTGIKHYYSWHTNKGTGTARLACRV